MDFPSQLFKPILRNWHINVRGRGPSETVDGGTQVVYGRRPRWECTLEFGINHAEQALAWRALLARMRGRVNLMRFRVTDPYGPGIASIYDTYKYGGNVTHSDGTTHSDGAPYAQFLSAPLVQSGVTGATSIRVNAQRWGDLVSAGHYISIDDWLYVVTMVQGTGINARLFIEPPLRAPAPVGREVVSPAFTIMAFRQDDVGIAEEYRHGKQARVNLDLVEWIQRG